MRRADQFVIVGEGTKAPQLHQLLARVGKSSNHATLRPAKCSLPGGTRVFAFCGIGHPDKFYRTLEQLGLQVVDYKDFDDHHGFSQEEVLSILDLAAGQELEIVTTSKDHVRLTALGEIGARLAEASHVIEVDMRFDDEGFPRLVLEQAQRKFARR